MPTAGGATTALYARTEAEAELEENIPNPKITFLWEWDQGTREYMEAIIHYQLIII